MGARENECQISQNDILHMKFSFHNSSEIRHLFSWAAMRISLWCYYRQTELTYKTAMSS